MKIKEVPGTERFCIERDGEELHTCPCCGGFLKSREAAEKVRLAIVEHQFSWRHAITLQEMERQ